jgi:hypothetical protein
MKRFIIIVSLFFLAFFSKAQSTTGIGKKFSPANIDSVVKRVNAALGGKYGVLNQSTGWVTQ